MNAPNGGVVVLRGNMLQKGLWADNAQSVLYGEEGLAWPANTLELGYNALGLISPAGALFRWRLASNASC